MDEEKLHEELEACTDLEEMMALLMDEGFYEDDDDPHEMEEYFESPFLGGL